MVTAGSMMTRSPLAVVLILMTFSVPLKVSIGLDTGKAQLTLLSNQRTDVGFETSNTNTHNHDTDSEARNGSIRVGDDLGNRRDNQDNMTDQGDTTGDLNRLESTPVLICHVGTEKRHNVGPKLVATFRQLSSISPQKDTHNVVRPVEAR